MPILVTINTITSGASPYDVWVCDDCTTAGTCQYINTITTVPYSFTLPTIFETYPTYVIKIIDNNGCIYCSDQCFSKQFQNGDCMEFMDGVYYDFQ